jgi:hypothetical protein
MKASVTDQAGDRRQMVTVEKDDTEAAPPKVDFQVKGRLRPLKQDNDQSCWATVATILFSWRHDTDAKVIDVLSIAGQKFVDLFTNQEGLKSADKPEFLQKLGLKAEPGQTFSVELLEQLLRQHGPLWITVDEDSGADFSVHARVLIGLRGDGTPEGTTATFLNPLPNAPSPDSESVATLLSKLAQLAAGDLASSGTFRPQVVHF